MLAILQQCLVEPKLLDDFAEKLFSKYAMHVWSNVPFAKKKQCKYIMEAVRVLC